MRGFYICMFDKANYRKLKMCKGVLMIHIGFSLFFLQSLFLEYQDFQAARLFFLDVIELDTKLLHLLWLPQQVELLLMAHILLQQNRYEWQ